MKFLKCSLILLMSITSFVSCSSDAEDILGTDEDIHGTDNENTIATINLTEGGAASDIFYAEAEGSEGGLVYGRVIFSSPESSMSRLYVTETLPGGSSEPFEIIELNDKSTKADGSIDLSSDSKEALDFTFTLNVPDSVEEGSIVYNFWATTGKGDFRDSSKRLAVGVGTIEVVVSDVEVDSNLITYSNIKLEAPAESGTSSSFVSFYNGQVYQISDGTEYAAFWDLGYFHFDSTGANLASPLSYNTAVVNVPEVTSTDVSELNSTYFQLNNTSVDFDSVEFNSDLDDLTVSALSSQEIDGLQVDDVIEFMDNYGKKGLIKVNEIEPGYSPSTDYINIDIKIQSYSEVVSD